MCLYPKLIINKKYQPTKKNGGNVPQLKDPRTGWVPVGCGKCMECRKQKAREWSVRLQEEIKTNRTGKFITLTFSNEELYKLNKEISPEIDGYEKDNEIATLAVRRFLERWRKKNKVSIKHWLITELGQPDNKHQGTENLHIHGILFTDKPEEIQEKWKYGYVYIGDYVNNQTINYCVKYFTKMDEAHKEYKPKILTSPGIGANYLNRTDAINNKYNENGETRETYKTDSGQKINLPIYWRNKIYSDEEKENLWIKKLDKQERYVDGIKVDTSNGLDTYYEMLNIAREKNIRLGYGDNINDWDRKEYERKIRNLKLKKRFEKFGKNEET